MPDDEHGGERTRLTCREWDEHFEELLRGQLKLLPADGRLLPGSDLRALGLESMPMVQLVVALEEAYGVVFPPDLLGMDVFSTPRDVWDALTRLRSEG